MTHSDNDNSSMNSNPPATVCPKLWSVIVVLLLTIGAGSGLRRWHDAKEAGPSKSEPVTAESAATSATLSPGTVLFQVHCAKCHGPDGRGDAEAMARLRPPPRDLAERPWRIAITRDSIRRVIADGIPGTAMAAQGAALSAADLETLTDHVLLMVKQLPVVERSFTPQQQLLVKLGFDVERVPTPAPSLTVENDQGGTLSLTDCRGSWVLLEFWGVSCEPCRKTLRALQRLSVSSLGEQLKIVPVCADTDDAETAQNFMSRIAPSLSSYIDATGIGIAKFSVQALPMTWLIDPEGNVRGTCIGSIDWDSDYVRKALRAVLAQDRPPQPVWTVTDCAAAPSHLLYDPESESLFITQISGVGDAKDGVGAISRFDLQGRVIECQWAAGFDAPKGLARYHSTLWVSDIDRLHEIDIKTGEPKACHEIPNAKFLTGVTVDSEGTVYVADMLTSTIYQCRAGEITKFADGDALESPAGLLADGRRLIIAPWGLTTDYTTRDPGRFLILEGQKIKVLAKPLGNLYGIASDGAKGWFASDFATGVIWRLSESAEPEEILRLAPGTGGIDYIPDRRLLIVAELTSNRISAFDLTQKLKLEPLRTPNKD